MGRVVVTGERLVNGVRTDSAGSVLCVVGFASEPVECGDEEAEKDRGDQSDVETFRKKSCRCCGDVRR